MHTSDRQENMMSISISEMLKAKTTKEHSFKFIELQYQSHIIACASVGEKGNVFTMNH